jgi:hypothetical protein
MADQYDHIAEPKLRKAFTSKEAKLRRSAYGNIWKRTMVKFDIHDARYGKHVFGSAYHVLIRRPVSKWKKMNEKRLVAGHRPSYAAETELPVRTSTICPKCCTTVLKGDMVSKNECFNCRDERYADYDDYWSDSYSDYGMDDEWW